MDRKEIEKAARKFVMKTSPAMSYEYFSAGAEWRINSVWHSTDELPKQSGYLAVLMANGFMETMHYTVGIGFQEMQLKGYKLWAYVPDLIPGRKEE